MIYDPDRHHRRSIRLKGYDYTQDAVYFVTLCTHGRGCLFGEVVEGVMRHSTAGFLVKSAWLAIPDHHPHVVLDEFVIMPNHIHGIVIFKSEGVATNWATTNWATQASPLQSSGVDVGATPASPLLVPPISGSPLLVPPIPPPPGFPSPGIPPREPPIGRTTDGATTNWATQASPLRSSGVDVGATPASPLLVPPILASPLLVPPNPGSPLLGPPAPAPSIGSKPTPRSLGVIVGSFKSSASKRINELRQSPGAPIWQRNYYEHIVRDEDALCRIRQYILDNPAQWMVDRENPCAYPAVPLEVWAT